MKNIIDFGLYKDTLNKSQRVETTKRRDDKINFIKIKNHCSSKDSILVVGWKKNICNMYIDKRHTRNT